MINKIARQIHDNAVEKGFHNGELNTGLQLALIHSEVSEALEADRNDRYISSFVKHHNIVSKITKEYDNETFKVQFESDVKDTFEDELADIIIRTMDLAKAKDIDIESHILAKMRYNTIRIKMHGKKY